MRSLRRCFGNRPPTLNLLRTGISEVGAAAPTPIKVRDNKHTRERIRTKTCKPRKGQITDFGPPEAGKPWAEIGNKSFAATSDGRDDAVEVGVGHGRTGRKAEATVEQVFCHFSPHHPGFWLLVFDLRCCWPLTSDIWFTFLASLSSSLPHNNIFLFSAFSAALREKYLPAL